MSLINRVERNPVFKKVHFLQVKKSNLIPVMRMSLDPKDFEDFIMTEILVEYGRENYIDFDDLIDNYAGSRLYEILNTVYKKEVSKILSSPVYSIIPASEGSLTRILLDYSANTSDTVIKTPRFIDSDMLKLRSEYPEEMSVLLSNKLVECHKQIYNKMEQVEIIEAYHDLLSKKAGLDSLRAGVIKLMTFWGYGSLVNSLQEFNLIKDSRNYQYFNCSINDKDHKFYYNRVFEDLIKSINLKMREWSSMWPSIETPNKMLKSITNIDTVGENYVLTTVLASYGYMNTELRADIYNLQFLNCLLGFFTVEEFIADLQIELNKIMILSSVPISYKERFNFLIMINVLRDIWLKNNRCNYSLDYTRRLERLPDNIPNYRSLMKSFDVTLQVSETYFHSALNNELLSFILSTREIVVGNDLIRINSKISKPSKTRVPLSSFIKFKRPIKDEIFDDEDWEELEGEISVSEFDEDYAEEKLKSLEDRFGGIYKPSTDKVEYRKSGKLITADITWVVMPFSSSNRGQANLLRQVGENLIVLTNSYYGSFVKNYPNSGVRLVDFSRRTRRRQRPLFVHYSLSDLIYSTSLVDQVIGGVEIKNLRAFDQLHYDIVRGLDGEICPTYKVGFKITGMFLGGGLSFKTDDDKVSIVDLSKGTNEQQAASEIDKDRNKILEYNKVIDSFKGRLSDESLTLLKNKYLGRVVKSGASMEVIVKSIMGEAELNILSESIANNTIDISPSDQIKTFLSPVYFGTAYGTSTSSSDPIKDKKVRTELKAFHHEMPKAIGSGVIKLSRRFSSIIEANVKMWNIFVKQGDFKTENKKFLLTSFIAMCSSARPGDDESKDYMWQEVVNKITLYMSSTSPDLNDDFGFLESLFSVRPASRVKYRPEGF
jgi:hypothetical protein